MGDVVKLNSDSPLSWSVEEALERALEKVRSGEFDADKVFVALCRTPQDGVKTARVFYTMAGMQLPEALGWLHIHMDVLMSDNH